MNIPTKKLASGFELPVYGLGTWQMGGRWEADTANDEKELAAIKGALDRGITHLDTAESYGAGHSEELVGRAIKGRDRSQLTIVSKVSGHNQAYETLLRSCEASLRRLGTDYLDVYLLHRYPEPGIPIAETMKAMDRLVAEGKVKHIGVCNMTVSRLKSVQEHSTNKIVCNQLHYSLECREITERGILEYCQQNDIFVTAWGPLQKGNLRQATILHELARKYDKTPYQIALNWLITQDNVITIPKTSHLEHLDENLGVLGWDLSSEDMTRLTTDFPGQTTISERVPLDYQADIEP